MDDLPRRKATGVLDWIDLLVILGLLASVGVVAYAYAGANRDDPPPAVTGAALVPVIPRIGPSRPARDLEELALRKARAQVAGNPELSFHEEHRYEKATGCEVYAGDAIIERGSEAERKEPAARRRVIRELRRRGFEGFAHVRVPFPQAPSRYYHVLAAERC